jgi:hypothetical protein
MIKSGTLLAHHGLPRPQPPSGTRQVNAPTSGSTHALDLEPQLEHGTPLPRSTDPDLPLIERITTRVEQPTLPMSGRTAGPPQGPVLAHAPFPCTGRHALPD